MADDERSLEEMLRSGEILEIGEAVIEDEEMEIPLDVDEIPVHVEEPSNEDYIDRSMLPEADNNFQPRARKLTPLPSDKGKNQNPAGIDWSRLPALVIYTGQPQKVPKNQAYDTAGLCSASSVKVGDAQKRLEQLAELMLGEEKIGSRVAKVFGRETERDRLKAFGEYFAGHISSRTGYISPEQFVMQAEKALNTLKSGEEGGRPLRRNIRDALSGKDESVYNSIRQRLPEIARAVATTGFAMELNQIYNDAGKIGAKPYEYAREIRNHRHIDRIAERLMREGLK